MTLSDIKNKIYFLTKSNSSDFPASDMLILINNAYERVAGLVLKADDRWQWDDSNQQDLPIATTNITANQKDYTLASTHLTIDRVEVQDSNGTWRELNQIDQQQLKRGSQISLSQYLAGSGSPLEYDIVGSSIFLYPTPSTSVTSGLKVYFTRGPVLFTSSDLSTGTATPGFNSLFHDIIPLWVAYDFAISNGSNKAAALLQEIQRKEDELYRFYGQRNHDNRPRLTTTGTGIMGATSGFLGYGFGDSNR